MKSIREGEDSADRGSSRTASPASGESVLVTALTAIKSQCSGHSDEFSRRVWLLAHDAIRAGKVTHTQQRDRLDEVFRSIGSVMTVMGRRELTRDDRSQMRMLQAWRDKIADVIDGIEGVGPSTDNASETAHDPQSQEA